MNSNISRFLLLVGLLEILVFMTACNKKSPQAYRAWVEEHLQSKKQVDGYKLSALYIPEELHLQGIENQITEDTNSYHYFQFNIYRLTSELTTVSQREAQKVQQEVIRDFYAYRAETDFVLLSGLDSIPCVLAHAEEASDQGRIRISLVFPETPLGEDPHLIFKGNGLGITPSHYVFSRATITNRPALKLP
ncbi:MAG: hypothetical protein AAGI38_04055 [Bacteroidota bacterium]